MIFEKAGVGTSTEVNYDSKSRNDGIKEIINNDNILIEGFLPEESDLLNEVICIRNTDNDNSNYENFQVDLTRSPEFNTSNSKAIDELMLNRININSDTLYFTFHENNEVDIGSKTDRNTEAILKNNKLTEFSTLCNIKESNNHIGNYNLTNRIPIINLVLSESNVNVQNNYCEIKTINDKQNNVSKTVYEFLKYIERIQNLICVNFRKTKYLRSGIVGLNIFGFKCESKTKRMKKKKMDNNVIKNHFQLSIKNKMNIFRLRDSRKSDGTEFVIDLGSSFFQIPSEVNSLQNENTSVDSTKNDGIETFVLFSDKEIKTMIMNDFGGNKGNLSNKIIELNDNDSIVKKAEFDKKDEFFVTEKNQENVVELEKKNSHFENTNSELFFGGDNDSNDTDTKTEGCENNTTYDEHEKYLYSTSKDSDKINMDNANNFDDNIIDGIIMEGFDYFCVENENKTKYTTSESNYSNKESDLGKYRYERNDIDRLSVFNNMYCERITEGNNGKLDEFNYNEGIDILLDNESYSVDKSRNKFPVIESEGDDGENINSSEIKDAYSAIIEEEYVVNDLLKSESTNLQFNIEGAKQQIENCYINDRENMLLLENFIEGSSHEQTNDASRELETRNEINTEFKKKGNKINSVIDSHSEKSTISEIPNLKETEYELNLELNSKKKKFGVFDKLICLTRNRNIVRMHSSNFTKETIKAIDIIKSSRKTNNKSGLIK
ncbi:hypothetical protein FG379_001817 [Cryptosporidium bovis]|uniref:uncharacterized protein n=1 Tax=Cryptosporidium bovis TaxID=310047 RepID=UPI00351A1D00|nr:hypothetical protein FG379_001817 [Cryptosporidium bovis]